MSTYVLDLLEDEEIVTLIAEAHRILDSKGLAGLVSLTRGFTLGSWLVGRYLVCGSFPGPVCCRWLPTYFAA